jgi:hypothetical protein
MAEPRNEKIIKDFIILEIGLADEVTEAQMRGTQQ